LDDDIQRRAAKIGIFDPGVAVNIPAKQNSPQHARPGVCKATSYRAGRICEAASLNAFSKAKAAYFKPDNNPD
jgi:hypothetical protein